MSLTPMILLAARGALVLAAGLVAASLLRRASASTRHLVLLASFVALLAMPLLAAVAPAWHVASAPNAAGEPLADPATHVGPLPYAPDGTVARETPIVARGAATTGDARAFTLPRVSLAAMLSVAWAIGALAVIARLVVGTLRARRIAARAVDVDDARRAIIDDARATVGAPRAAVRVSDAVDVPSVTGVLAPVILMPRASTAWSAERWRVVLMHELAHVRRRDCLAQIVATIGCAVSWFNPLAWLAARRMRVERELAADDAVVAAGARATSYASHLVAIAAAASARGALPGALAMAHPSELERRVRALVASARSRRRDAWPVALAVVAGSATFAFAVACASPDAPASRAVGTVASPVANAAAPAPSARASSPLADAIARSVGAPVSRTELTIDPAIQAIVDDEIARTMAEWRAMSANIIVLDPTTGAILALAGRSPADDPALAVERAVVPASTFKMVALAAALDEGTVAADQRFFCDNGRRAYGKRILNDVRSNGWLDVPQIFATSSNVGATKIFDTLGADRFGKWIAKFHFGERPAVQLPNVASGAVPSLAGTDPYDAAVVVIGEGVTASPLQVAAAYAAIANDGVYNAPTLVRRVLGDDGRATWEHRPTRERIVKSATAQTVMSLLEQVVTSEHGTGRAARVDGARVAGKTGTGDLGGTEADEHYYSTFVGAIPAERPRFVILVGVETKKRDGVDEGYGGGKIAAPAFSRIATRAIRE